MTDNLTQLAPQELWRHFAELSRIPRPSGKEQAALDYVKRLAEERNAGYRQDEYGNLVVFVDGGIGPTVAVQAHLDMVCEKDPDVEHDFTTDPIKVAVDGNRVHAEGTTLGADNGIGAAAALALLTSDGIKRGPLELVFTVEEETGLHGAMAFNAALLQSKILINLDSEDADELTIGCAGGATVEVELPLKWEPVPEGWVSHELVVSGLQGGHSGVDIDKGRANAIKVLLGALGGLRSALEVRLAGLEAGRAHNVIPREAKARIVVSEASAGRLTGVVESLSQSLRSEWGDKEPGVKLTVNEAGPFDRVLQARHEDNLLEMMNKIPDGAHDFSADFPEKVETSSNLAQVKVDQDRALVIASARSLSAHKLFRTRTQIATAGMKLMAKATVVDSYPGWEPELDSHLLEVAKQQYEAVNGRPASIQVVHAGLECGVLVSKKPDMQAISFGPRLTGAHSPNESVDADTVDSMWRLLVGLLGALADEG